MAAVLLSLSGVLSAASCGQVPPSPSAEPGGLAETGGVIETKDDDGDPGGGSFGGGSFGDGSLGNSELGGGAFGASDLGGGSHGGDDPFGDDQGFGGFGDLSPDDPSGGAWSAGAGFLGVGAGCSSDDTAYPPEYFPFKVTNPDDGQGPGGGSQETHPAELIFWGKKSPELGHFVCKMGISMPLRCQAYGRISADQAANWTSEVVTFAAKAIQEDPPYGTTAGFCLALRSKMTDRFKSKNYSRIGARVRPQ